MNKTTEQRIAELISQYDEEYFDVLISGDPEWPLSYHLCSLRRSLLNWYSFHGKNALEIGAGFGALTGILCENYDCVDAVEIDPLRAESLRTRYKHRSGLNVYPMDIREFTPEQSYDCILMVDFAEEYSGDFAELLQRCMSWLKDDGVILLGLRNAYGLKYNCGMTDEYMTVPFGQDQSNPLYSRHQIRNLLERCDISAYWYYPLPDSRYAQIICSEEDMPDYSVRDRIISYDPFSCALTADERDVIDRCLREGTLPENANDYLLEIRKTPRTEKRYITSAILSADREHARAYKTVFYSDHTVEKHALFPEGIASLKEMVDNLKELENKGIPVVEAQWQENHVHMPRIREITIQERLAQLLRERKTEEFYELTDRLYTYIRKSSAESQGILQKGYIDLIPLNAFWKDREIVFFDQEFSKENCSAKYILWRALYYLWVLNPDLEKVMTEYEVQQRYGLTEHAKEYFNTEMTFVDQNRQRSLYTQYYIWSVHPGKIQYTWDKLYKAREDSDLKEVKRIHEIQLDMYKKFREVCQKYGLRYFAVHGTLLGAVRHHGFIPWDDDMDLAMPREDYDKLTKIASAEFGEPYFFQTPENDPECFYGGYGKLRNENTTAIEWQNQGHRCHQGIWIDIFPLDHLPEDQKQRERMQKEIKRRQKLLYAKIYPVWTNMISDARDDRISIYYALSRHISHEQLCKMLHKELTSSKPSSQVSILACYYKFRKNRNVFLREETEHLLEVPFEDTVIPVTEAYDIWLKNRYGENYMAYPAKDAQKIRHSANYDTERSYKEMNIG
ncbi:MAG: LicD family protein [Solobacterium sp.]|nr:LicD family protein [Solobacterium sp.]